MSRTRRRSLSDWVQPAYAPHRRFPWRVAWPSLMGWCRALDLGERDFQHHLVAAAHGNRIDHFVGAARETGGQIAGLLRLDRGRGGAAQDHAVADALDLDI